MNARFWLVAVVLIAACGSCNRDKAAVAKKAPSTRRAQWEEYGFARVKVPRSRSFNLTFTAPGLRNDEAEVRLAFEIQPGEEDYYFVGVRRARVELGKVECGVEMSLARWDAPGPEDEPFFSRKQRITVMRRPGSIAVAVGHRRVIRASDDTFVEGGARIGAKHVDEEVATPTLRRVGEIYAADDFMRTKQEESTWRSLSGQWGIESLKNPGLSANAFRYAGRATSGRPGVSLVGESWWDNYTLEVSAKPMGSGAFGVVFRHVDKDHYYLFRLAEASPAGLLQLARVIGGTETVLAEGKTLLKSGQWYRLQLTGCADLLTAHVDGNEVFRVRDGHLSFGRAGLYVADATGAEFDDVFVEGERGVIDSFGDGGISWYPKGGGWSVERSETSARLKANGPPKAGALGTGKLLGGEAAWADCRVSATLEPGASGRVGVILRYRDESAYDEFVYDVDRQEYQLIVVRDGRSRVADNAGAAPLRSTRRLSLEASGGVLVCKVDGARVLSHFDDRLRSGKAGLSVGKGSSASFQALSVTFPYQRQSRLVRLDTFARETTMANWAAARSDWTARPTTVWGEERTIYWHRGAFPRGGSVRGAVYFSTAQQGVLRLFTGCDLVRGTAGARVTDGYELVVRSAAPTEKYGAIELRRNRHEVDSRRIRNLGGRHRVELKVIADHVVAQVDGRVVLAFKDESPLNGWSTGYAAEHVLVRPDQIDVSCDNTLSYSFARAADDWRSAGGKWLVTNRWQCDPRWSFFGGQSLTGVAAIWNKRSFRGDMVLEYAVGIRHQGHSGYARYASNMNAVICGDGSSLNSGYGLIFGGWGNTKTAITRDGKIVAESTFVIPTSGMHRRWFYLAIEKKGGQLKYYIDGTLILEYTDPDPLSGGQVALWTWQNGLMVGRVRISADRIGPREHHALQRPDVSPCIYAQ